jgi:hypothetical protein
MGFAEDALGETFLVEDIIEEGFVVGGDRSFDPSGEVDGFLAADGFVG